MTRALVLGLLLGALAASGARADDPELAALLRDTPADSLVAPLRAFEARHSPSLASGEAAMVLGKLHYTRGEYHQAVDAFGRAAARLEPALKVEARYWGGLAWLGIGDAAQARAALEEVAAAESPWRARALFGVALAWEQLGRPERALQVLDLLLAGDPGEVGPSALERQAALDERLHRPAPAARARARLTKQYPRSVEAARASLGAATAAALPESGPVSVQIGAFSEAGRARGLAEAARRAGFPNVQVTERAQGGAVLHVVRLGTFAGAAEARAAGEKASQLLGVTFQLVAAP